MRTLLFVFLALLCISLRPLTAAERQLVDVLPEYARAHNLSFTIEYLQLDPVVIGGWRSKLVSGPVTTTTGDDVQTARAALEAGLKDWVVVPATANPRVWHLIDRRLITRSPMDGQTAELTHNGTAAALVDTLAKDPALHVMSPTVFASGETGRGASIHLAGFHGRIRDALTVSFAVDDVTRQTVQWVAECSETATHAIIATIRIQTSPKAKDKPEPRP